MKVYRKYHMYQGVRARIQYPFLSELSAIIFLVGTGNQQRQSCALELCAHLGNSLSVGSSDIDGGLPNELHGEGVGLLSAFERRKARVLEILENLAKYGELASVVWFPLLDEFVGLHTIHLDLNVGTHFSVCRQNLR